MITDGKKRQVLPVLSKVLANNQQQKRLFYEIYTKYCIEDFLIWKQIWVTDPPVRQGFRIPPISSATPRPSAWINNMTRDQSHDTWSITWHMINHIRQQVNKLKWEVTWDSLPLYRSIRQHQHQHQQRRTDTSPKNKQKNISTTAHRQISILYNNTNTK